MKSWLVLMCLDHTCWTAMRRFSLLSNQWYWEQISLTWNIFSNLLLFEYMEIRIKYSSIFFFRMDLWDFLGDFGVFSTHPISFKDSILKPGMGWWRCLNTWTYYWGGFLNQKASVNRGLFVCTKTGLSWGNVVDYRGLVDWLSLVDLCPNTETCHKPNITVHEAMSFTVDGGLWRCPTQRFTNSSNDNGWLQQKDLLPVLTGIWIERGR